MKGLHNTETDEQTASKKTARDHAEHGKLSVRSNVRPV